MCNGAVGTVLELVYQPGKSPPELPDVVIVQFDSYAGESWDPNVPRVCPIVPITREWTEHRSLYARTMIPLAPAHGITIYRSQGFTITSNMIVNLGNKE